MPELDIDLWLKPEDVEPEAEVVFIDAGEHGEIPATEGKPATPTFEITVQLKAGQQRIWTMNVTSQRAIAQAYSTNTDNWVGKKAIAFTTSQNVRGAIKKVIYARIPAQ